MGQDVESEKIGKEGGIGNGSFGEAALASLVRIQLCHRAARRSTEKCGFVEARLCGPLCFFVHLCGIAPYDERSESTLTHPLPDLRYVMVDVLP